MAAAPPLRDRGHRTGGGEARAAAAAAAAASSSRAVTSSGPRTEETASGWRGNSAGTQSRRARRGVQGGEREGEEPTGPFGGALQRKLTVAAAAATAAAADRNLSSAPRGALRRRGGGRAKEGKSRGGPAEGGKARRGTASTRALLPAAAARAAVRQPGIGPAGWEGAREGGRLGGVRAWWRRA